jgi:uncharacterized protein (DUF302 family)
MMKDIRLVRFVKIGVLVMILLGASAQSSRLLAQDNSLRTVQSKVSFDHTVKSLRQLVSKNGMMVLSELNQGNVLSMTGLKLNAESLFVGNPNIGKKLFTADRGVGIVVPVRVNVYENTDGKTYVSYFKPSAQLTRFKNENIRKIARMLDEKLAKITDMLSH